MVSIHILSCHVLIFQMKEVFYYRKNTLLYKKIIWKTNKNFFSGDSAVDILFLYKFYFIFLHWRNFEIWFLNCLAEYSAIGRRITTALRSACDWLCCTSGNGEGSANWSRSRSSCYSVYEVAETNVANNAGCMFIFNF